MSRLNHLQNSVSADAVWNSYTSIKRIRERVHEGWTASDEEALCNADASYAALQARIRELSPAVDPVGTEGPFAMAMRDPELAAAARAFEEEHRRLDRELVVPSS